MKQMKQIIYTAVRTHLMKLIEIEENITFKKVYQNYFKTLQINKNKIEGEL